MKGRALSIVGVLLAVLVLQAHGYSRGDKPNTGIATAALSRAEAGVHPTGPGAVIEVADPTGDPTQDRPNIEAAIARAKPGDTVLFAKGTYATVIEGPAGICVPVPDVTLLGSVEGTTLFGVDEPSFEEGPDGILFGQGGVTVRRLTFESYAFAIGLTQDCAGNPRAFGGHVIADNVFKNQLVSVFGDLRSSNPTLITRNQFINVAQQYTIAGGILHFTNNTNRTPNPNAIPSIRRPLNAGLLLGFAGLECNDNVFDNNIVDGNVDGFQFVAVDGACRRNVLRNNRVSINEAILEEFDFGTLAGFLSIAAPLANHLVEGNSLDGTQGLAIGASGVTNSTFQGNDIRGVRRSPVNGGFGGVAILLERNSRGNAVASNRLQNNQFCDVLLRRNTVNNVVVEPNDTVIDRGRRNLVLSEGSCDEDASGFEADLADDQVVIPAKIKTMLEMYKRVRSEREGAR